MIYNIQYSITYKYYLNIIIRYLNVYDLNIYMI